MVESGFLNLIVVAGRLCGQSGDRPPADLRRALHRHPKIRDVAVFGIPDEAWLRGGVDSRTMPSSLERRISKPRP
jgi:hypothetical protein